MIKSCIIFSLLIITVACNGGPPSKNNDELCVDSVNRYTEYDTFGSVVVQCPLEKVWPGIGNTEKWFKNVVGVFLENITTVGKTSEIGTYHNYHVNPTTAQSTSGGNTQQRIVNIDGFNFELITTFDFSSLSIGPDCSPPCKGWQNPENNLGSWTTRVRAHKVFFHDPACFNKDDYFSACSSADGVDWTLIDFGQWGDINVPTEFKPLVRAQIQSFFYSVFAPELKKAFDNCENREEFDNTCTAPEIVEFHLVDEDTDFIRVLNDGDTITNGEGNIEAIAAPESSTIRKTKSVHFEASNGDLKSENLVPYTIVSSGSTWTPGAGSYSITATPYEKNNLNGKAGVQKTINLNVI